MTWTQVDGELSALPARRGDEPGAYLWIRAGERHEQMTAELFLPAVAADELDSALGIAVGTVRVDGQRVDGRRPPAVRARAGRPRRRLGDAARPRRRHPVHAERPPRGRRLLPALRGGAPGRRRLGHHSARRRESSARPRRIAGRAARSSGRAAGRARHGLQRRRRRGHRGVAAACPAAADVGVPLAIRLPARPTLDPPPICPLVSYSAVFATAAWGAMPKQLRAADPDVQVWQERSLLYSCDRCDAAAFRLPWIRGHHPEWILRTADGAEIHPDEHPGWVLLDFGDADYQSAWSLRIQQSLTDGGWTGVDVADAGNEPEWSGTPVDPRTGAELEPDDRATYLAQALSLVHAAMRTQGFFLLAQNGPPGIVEPAQINSADALTAGTGFARLRGAAWTGLLGTTFRCSASAWPRSSFETEPDPGPKTGRLRAGRIPARRDASGRLRPRARHRRHAALRPRPGRPDPDVLAEQVGEAWTRTYPHGAVAVNPSDLPTGLSLGTAGPITLPPGGAAIAVGSRLVTSY